jgi:heptosyltransferase-2
MLRLPEPPFGAALLMPAWLGDAVMASALLPPLASLSGGPVQLWCRPTQRTLFAGQREVADIQDYDPRGKHRGLAGLQRLRAELGASGRLPRAVWLVPDSFSAALAAWATGVPARIGFGGQGRGLLLSHRLRAPQDRRRHWIDGRAGLLAPFLAGPTEGWQPCLGVEPTAVARVEGRLTALGVRAQRAIILVPGATYGSAKRWRGFAALGRQLPADAALLIAGVPAEAAIAAELARELAAGGRQVVDLCGALDLGELAALLQLARCTVTNDTGPLHLAAAVGGRVLGLFLSTAPEWTAPRGAAARWLAATVPCRPCFARECPLPAQICGDAISAAAVRAAIADWLAPEAA